jgi:hypothetical protein
VLLLGAEWSCQKRQVSTPVPQAPAAIQPAAQAPAPTPSVPSAPNAVTPAQAHEVSPYQVNKTPAAAAKKPAKSPTPPAAATPVSAPDAPAPKLGDVLSADQQKQLSATTDQSLARAQASLNSIGTRQLSKDQQSQVEQIKNFMKQAQSRRESDSTGAKSLAERAEVLARDLAAAFR